MIPFPQQGAKPYDGPMTIAEALAKSGLEMLDAELLAAFTLNHDRTWVIAHTHDLFDDQLFHTFEEYSERRMRGEPVAYIVGQKEFFGRMFRVTPATLVPRPATEELVQTVLDFLAGKKVENVRVIDNEIVAWTHAQSDVSNVKTIVDAGTGSGCIAITLACERPDLHIIATDISGDALAIARENAELMNVADRMTFKHGRGFAAAGVITEPFLLVSNPPYIPDNTILDRDVAAFEPSSALFAGKDGTGVLHPLVQETLAHPLCKGFVMECREEQVIDFVKLTS